MVKPLLSGGAHGRVAAIDVGSNSVHMLVVDVSAEGELKTIDITKDQTRLGADLDERLILDADALTKVSAVLKRMKDIADAHGATIRAVGTHALREARNGHEFAQRLAKRTGVNVEIVSGREEARLVYLGVQYGLPVNDKSALLVDIGGGSTEILLGQWGEERFSTSLKLGAVRLTQKYLLSDPLDSGEVQALQRYIESRLEPVVREIRKVGFDYAVGSSGTIKAIKSIALGLAGKSQPNDYHGVVLTAEELEAAKNAILGAVALKDRKLIPGLDAKRADIIVAGVMVLDALTRQAGVPSWTVSLSAIREGIVIDTLMREGQWLRGNPQDVRWRSVRAFGQKLQVDEAHAWHITSLAVSLFDQLQSLHGLSPSWRESLRCAAFLHEGGRFLSYSGHHKHAHYLIRNSGLLGFTESELEMVALVVRYHRKRGPRESDDALSALESEEKKNVERLSAILRLAASLDRGRLGKIQELRLSVKDKKCSLSVYLHGASDAFLEMYEAALEKQHFEKAFGLSLDLDVSKLAGPRA